MTVRGSQLGQDQLCRLDPLRSRPVKIDKNRTARPLRLNDKVLNKTLGAVIARLSQDDVQAIVLRHAEVEVARKIRQRWSAQAKSVAESSAPNARWSKEIAASADWASVADEALAYIRADQDQLDKEELLARANIFLCDKVIAALVDASGGAPPATEVERPRFELSRWLGFEGHAGAGEEAGEEIGLLLTRA